jgi:Rad3-related DNA helicase
MPRGSPSAKPRSLRHRKRVCACVRACVRAKVIIEPFDERMPSVPDPVIQLSCLDASLAMRPVFSKFQSVVITSGTLSPIDLYPRILSFSPKVVQSLNMTLTRCARAQFKP